jgi:hypothetical protein
VVVAYVRTVRTSSGARAVQIVHSSRRGSRSIEHLGSAHDDAGVEALKAAAPQRLAAGQAELDLAWTWPRWPRRRSAGDRRLPDGAPVGGVVPSLRRARFRAAVGGAEVFRGLVLARVIEPTSKQDSLRVLEEVGVPAASYATLRRRLPA